MATKPTRKEKIAKQKETAAFSPKEIQKQAKKNQSIQVMLGLFIAVLAFLLYANSFNGTYVLDDFGLIHDNLQTKKGISAIPDIFKSSYRFGMNITDYQLYRPLSKAMFAVEWNIAPNKPMLSHVINVLFYALSCFVFFRVLCRYMKGQVILPFLTILLFTVHPIHAEVVANIKSRDEIMCFLLCMLAAGAFQRWITENKTKFFVLGLFCYFSALFSKETAITFLAIIPMMFYFFTEAKSKHYTSSLIGMGLLTGIFLLIRRKILGSVDSEIPMIDNYIAGLHGFFLQRANSIYMLGYYLKTLLFPDVLISDGSYNHFKAVSFSSWKFFVPMIIFIGSFIYALLRFRKKDVVSFGILFFFATVSIVSNVIILIGTDYGERLMYMPSMGLCIIAAYALLKIFNSEMTGRIFTSVNTFFTTYKKPVLVAAVLAIPLCIKSFGRSAEWKDNYTLYMTDLEKIPDSAHMLFYIANHITSDETFEGLDSNSIRKNQLDGIEYLTRAVKIYPEYADGYQRRAYIYSQIKKDSLAEIDYERSMQLNPTNPVTNNNYGFMLFNQRRYDEAKKYFETAIRYNPIYAHALNNLASSYGVYGEGEREQAEKDPARKQQHLESSKTNFETSVSYFLKSIDADREFEEPYRLVAMTYRNLGDEQDALRYESLLGKLRREKKNAKN